MQNPVISYADLIEAHHQALLDEYLTQLIAELENDPFSLLWSELIDTFGEGRLMELGADL